MKKFKIIFNYLLGFLMTITFVFFLLFLTLKFLLNEQYFYQKLENNDYYDEVYMSIKEEMENNIISTGFSNSIIQDIYTKEEVKEDIKNVITNYYNGHMISLEKDNIYEKLKNNIILALEKENLKFTDTSDMKSFIQDMVQIYQNEISLYHMLDNYAETFYQLKNFADKGLLVVLITIICLIIICFIIKNTYLGSSIIASGIILVFLLLFILEKINIDYLLIITDNVSLIFKNIFYDLQHILYINSGLIVLGGLILNINMSKINVKVINRIN